ncbi:RNA polymerase III RPC4-domain-containing protein [Tuber brumale]|nr:RNA polymerase III RPC4-domain-containing protein [Tuber brumale]
MPPKLKAKPRPVARRGAATSNSALIPGDSTTLPENHTNSPAPIRDPSSVVATATEPVQNLPIPPPVGRLDSLSAARNPSISARGAAAPLVKFKPRNPGRRTQQERESLNARFQHTANPAPRPRASGSDRGTRGRRGGRGGRGGHDAVSAYAPATASGPFALGSVSIGVPRSRVAVERGMDHEKYKEFTRSGAKRDIKTRAKLEGEGEDGKTPRYTSSDDSDGPRMDVEFISLLDEDNSEDEDGDKVMDGGSSHWGAGAPIRVPRSEHVDRTAMVNTDASSKKGKFDSRIKNESPLEDSVKVKEEPADDNMATEWPSSPEASRKNKAPTSSPEIKKTEIKSPGKRRRSSSNKTKPLFTSAETKEELKVEEKDRLRTLEELAGSFTDIKLDQGGDAGMGEAVREPRNPETENQIFFFQFPTMLPQLVAPPPTKEKKPQEAPIAPTDPNPLSTEKHRMGSSTIPLSDINPKARTTVLPQTSGPPPSSAPSETKMPPLPTIPKQGLKAQQTLLEAFPPPGIAGKLRVHKSGRITILWGNPVDGEPFEMDVSRGTDCLFLQEAVAVKEVSPWGEEDVDEKGARKGAAFSLGQVKGRYVVSPDFDDLVRSEKRRARKSKAKDREAIN